MGKQKAPASTSPQVVATLSSLLLLVVSAALGFYFMELRGPGIRTLLSGSQASELMVLVGGLAAIVLTGHLSIANAARSAQGASGYRKLVKRASEIDYSDPEAVSQFDGVPEIRDLVSVLIAEKEQGHQLQDALESVRGETAGLYSGMERSLTDMGPMREEQPSELGRKVATLWNVLVDRVNEAESVAPQVASASSLSTAEGYELGAGAVEQRLRDLEERVQQLQTDAPASPPLLVAEEESGSTPLLVPESAHEVIELEERAAVSPLELQEEVPVNEPAPVAPVAPVVPSSAPSVLGGEPQEVSGLEALEPLSDEEMAAAAPQEDVDYSDNGSVIIQRPDFAALGMTPPPVAASDPVAPAPVDAVDAVDVAPVAEAAPATSDSMIMQSPFAAGTTPDASVDGTDPGTPGAPEFSVPWGETQAPAAEASTVEPAAAPSPTDVPVASPVDVDVDPVASSEPMSVPPALADNGEDDGDDDKTYTEWGGAGFGSLSDLTSSTSVGFGSAPADASPTQPQAAQEVGFGAPVDTPVDRQKDEATPSSSFSFTPMGSTEAGSVGESPVQDVSPASDVAPVAPSVDAADAVPGMAFPKFGAPQGNKDDRVEVTYDGTQAPAATDDFMSFDAPAEDALVEEGGLLEIDDDDVVDLNSLGAVETKE